MVTKAPPFFVSTDKSAIDFTILHDFLSNKSYWAKGRSRKTIEKSIENSLCFGVYTNKNELVGFARVVTDFAVFAWITDVFIREGFRGRGLGKILMQEIMAHPGLQGLQRWGLCTEDAHGLYEKHGFSIVSKPDMMMELIHKPG